MSWIKPNRAELLLQSKTFSAGIESIGTEVGLTEPEIEEFSDTVGVFSDNMSALIAAKASYDKAFETVLGDQERVIQLMRKYNNRIQNSSAVNNASRAKIGLPIPSGTSKKVVPQTVSGLMATPFANGTVRLQWSRNGNAPAVVFNVMVSDDSLNWSPLGGVTRTSITLNGFAPGEKKYFRIVATRGIASAVPSEPIVIYSNSGGNDLSVAA